MDEPRWISRVVADAIHTDMLITHGGLPGLRDGALLESALTRPRQRFAHDPACDLASIAASYGYGLARNHPYSDGNKRVAFVVMAVFLGLNGRDLVTDEADVVATMTALAAGELEEEPLTEWIRGPHFQPDEASLLDPLVRRSRPGQGPSTVHCAIRESP